VFEIYSSANMKHKNDLKNRFALVHGKLNWYYIFVNHDNATFKVSKKTKNITTKCHCDFECIGNNHWDTCSIAGKLKNKGLFIEKKSKRNNCAYNLSFGKTDICQCPTRHSIYQHYKR
jgi:hypothetical protein